MNYNLQEIKNQLGIGEFTKRDHEIINLCMPRSFDIVWLRGSEDIKFGKLKYPENSKIYEVHFKLKGESLYIKNHQVVVKVD